MGVELAVRTGVPEMEEVSDSELVYYVREALKSVPLGHADNYNQIKSCMFSNSNKVLTLEEVALQVTILKALSGAVSYIDNVQHESLLSAIFQMSLWDYKSPDVMDALVELVVSLASSSKLVDSCLEMLVSHFMPPNTFLELLRQPIGVTRKGHVLIRVHSAIKDIAHLMPLAPSRLWPIIVRKMPNVYEKEPKLVIYVENMLMLESGDMGKLIGDTMLTAVVDRLVDLDVEIEWEDILQDDSSKGIFEMELEDMDGAENGGNEFEEDFTRFKGFRENLVADKLDSVLVLMFEHLYSCNDGGRLVEVFEKALLQSFRKTVLTAYKSKFTQFVMFYACSLDPDGCGVRFGEMLADIFTGIGPPLERMSAVAYLASYLARAKFLSVSFILTMLQRVIAWCWAYCQNREADINPVIHRTFYSGCQAVMYVLCFRLRAVMDVPRLKSQLFHMPLESILKSHLEPLKVCLPSIVEEFLRQAKAARLFTLSETTFVFDNFLDSELSRAFGGVERLDMFFPFDPCLLRKSDGYIRPIFIYWSMVKHVYEDDEEGEGGSSDEEDEVVCGRSIPDDTTMAGSFDDNDLDIDEFDDSLNKMSITPKRNYSSNHQFGGRLTQMPSRIRPSMSPESL